MFAVSLLQTAVATERAKSSVAVLEGEPRYLASINLHTKQELLKLMSRVDEWLSNGSGFRSVRPITVILHGPEVDLFTDGHYAENRELVDQAAMLDAYQLIDVKVCQTYMRQNGIGQDDLPPFVDIVPFGPALETDLRGQGYVEF